MVLFDSVDNVFKNRNGYCIIVSVSFLRHVTTKCYTNEQLCYWKVFSHFFHYSSTSIFVNITIHIGSPSSRIQLEKNKLWKHRARLQ